MRTDFVAELVFEMSQAGLPRGCSREGPHIENSADMKSRSVLAGQGGLLDHKEGLVMGIWLGKTWCRPSRQNVVRARLIG